MSTPPNGHHPRPRGYFGQAQLEDLETAEEVLAAAQEHAAKLAQRDVTGEYLTGFETAIGQVREKITKTGQDADSGEAATLNADGAERALVIALQGIQSAAKQKHRMFAEDDDAATSFSTEGYLIGKRLNAHRPSLLQNADAIIAKAAADNLPGYAAAALAAVAPSLQTYKTASAARTPARKIAAWIEPSATPWSARSIPAAWRSSAPPTSCGPTPPNLRSIRKAFHLQQSRSFNG